MKQRVLQAHVQSYADPIAFRAGDRVQLSGRSDCWDGHVWLWAIGADGRAGWVPPGVLAPHGDAQVALHDFNAIELSVAAGETLDVRTCQLGWCWCENADGAQGWVPARCFSSD